jgi:transglutaminase-like putative cysteine protease
MPPAVSQSVMAPTELAPTDVRARLAFEVTQPVSLVLQVAVAAGVPTEHEELVVVLEGAELPVEEIEFPASDGSRAHLVTAGEGRLEVTYRARTAPRVATPAVPPTAAERLVALRQSRYCPSDVMAGLLLAELGHLEGDPNAARAMAEWVHHRLAYVPGSSSFGDSALDTLLAGQGVCRDFAHLLVTACRSLEVPARFVAVYAPGLAPMDFHAVVEVAGPDGWEVLDATHLAPRQGMVRIATGRDASDTPLATTLVGEAALVEVEVLATVDGDLPVDDHTTSVTLA